MLRHLMASWHLNIWKFKIWLSQERKELSKWNKKTFFLDSQVLSIRHTKETSKNVADTTLAGCKSNYFSEKEKVTVYGLPSDPEER